MKKNKREEEAEILRKMLSDSDTEPKKTETVKAKEEKSSSSSERDDGDVIRCPKCGYVLASRSTCPRCGYNGYVPMTKSETKRIRMILFPIILIIAIIYILWQKGVFG